MQRFGNAITRRGRLNLRHASYAADASPIEPGCDCVCCRDVDQGGLGITRAYIHHVTGKETPGAHVFVPSLLSVQ
jgi:queuine tRNA-ribosyltransferase